jgi:hypothetical protein
MRKRDNLAPQIALGMLGAGAGFAERGALGSAGGGLRSPARLPMDEAARLARARDMGFRTSMPLYHVSGESFSSFRSVPTSADGLATPGVSAALNPEVANEFAAARRSGPANPQIYPLFHRTDNPARLDLTGRETHAQVVETLRDAFDRGHDAVMLRNYTTPGGIEGQNIVIVRDANQLRSPFAMFDPARRDSANLLAGLAGAAAIPAGALAIPAAQAPIFPNAEGGR